MTADRATLTLLSPGLQTLIVDAGRPRSRSLGMPLGGAADRFSLAIGNALVGNPPDAAALEICLSGPMLQANAPLACVLFGAPFTMSSDQRDRTAGITFTLQPGERLQISGTARGMRAYFCVAGGIDAPVVLNSRSSLTSLKAGENLGCSSGTVRGRSLAGDLLSWLDNNELNVLPGGQADWFPASVLEESTEREKRFFAVSPASNRMGLRLSGEPLPIPAREMVSEPVCPGTVQVTRDGQCIILGVDGQTIGGYLKVAQVIRADLDRLGQLRPGEQVRFHYVTLEEAEELYRKRVKWLRELVTRLQVTCC